ncbi:MAG TPA: RIP metalloprotease RseP [Candidatus Acidoferrum sp.]|nr:RIP metalloprotease RseP [Candidatus Acidoferrum sp.]
MTLDIAIGMALVLGVLILIHEWGHFIVARRFGVRVDVFSIGFGPRLFGWKRGATDYRISAFPLGGYVRMAGQDLSEVDSNDVAPTGAPDELMSKPRWQRALISFAGPAVNLIFPIILLTGFFALVGMPYSDYLDKPVQIVAVPADNPTSPDALQPQDQIVSINGEKTKTWEQAENVLAKVGAKEKLHLEVLNGGKLRTVEVMPKGPLDSDNPIGFLPRAPVVDFVESGKPAMRAGIRADDTILSVNGRKIEVWGQFVESVRGSKGKTLDLEIRRKGEILHKTVTPVLATTETGESYYQIGISQQEEVTYRRVSLADGLRVATRRTAEVSASIIGVVGRLFSGRISVRQLHTVVEISRAAGNAVHRGPISVILLMAGMSINLGILNLLPIPILDGGNILLLTLEGIRRKDFSLRFKERFVQVGLVFLLVLFAYIMYNDVVGLLPTHS